MLSPYNSIKTQDTNLKYTQRTKAAITSLSKVAYKTFNGLYRTTAVFSFIRSMQNTSFLTVV